MATGHTTLILPDVVTLDAARAIRYRTQETSAGAVVGAGCNARRVRVAVEFSWREIGAITVEGGKLRFPIAPEAPGIYRFDLGDRVYIGEAARLRRRFRHYRAPGPSQATNLRLNTMMLPLLGAGGAVTVCTVTEAQVDIDGARAQLDLTRKASRLLVESAALTAARVAGEPVERMTTGFR